MPGSLRNSSMRRAMGSANRDMRAESEAGQVESAEHAGEPGLKTFVRAASGFVERRNDEVLKHFDIGGIGAGRTGNEASDRRGIDLEREHLLLSVHLHGDSAAA